MIHVLFVLCALLPKHGSQNTAVLGIFKAQNKKLWSLIYRLGQRSFTLLRILIYFCLAASVLLAVYEMCQSKHKICTAVLHKAK